MTESESSEATSPQPSSTSAIEVDPAVTALEERLGVRLPDPQVALAALTHKSFVNEHRGEGLTDNERLEFMGDAVIDLAVSHRLMERFPQAREGELSKIRAAVVDEAGLAALARSIDLGSLLRVGHGEELTGGRQKSSLLADAMEAVIAAVYLGGGMAPVLELADRFLGEAFARAAAGTLDRDFKTQLQELAQSRLRATPRYRVVAEHGPDHSKTFEVELDIRGEIRSQGVGRSKKDAEQAAAKIALEELTARSVAPYQPTAVEIARSQESSSAAAVTPSDTLPISTELPLASAATVQSPPRKRAPSVRRRAAGQSKSRTPSKKSQKKAPNRKQGKRRRSS